MIGAPTQDANGVLHYPVTSAYQGSAQNELRVLLPKSLGSGQRRFLFVLPVEAGTQSVYGDPVATLQASGQMDALQLILVVPAFTLTPWYADHPTDPTIRQESYLVEDLVPALDALFPETSANPGPPRRLLLGFSKSGLGALSLILRHQALFDAAAMWDAPLNQTTLSSLPGMVAVFGTQSNYDSYAIPKVLPLHAADFNGAARLWLGGYSSQAAWRNDMTAAHASMTTLGMAHAWVDGPQRAHRWDSGWLGEAVTFLHQAAPALVFAADAGVEAGPADAGDQDAGAGNPDGAPDDATSPDGATLDATAPDGASGSGGAGGAGANDSGTGPASSDDGACGCFAAGSRDETPLRAWLTVVGLALSLARWRSGQLRSARPRLCGR